MKLFATIVVTLSIPLTLFAVDRPTIVIEGTAKNLTSQNTPGAPVVAISGKVLTSNIATVEHGDDIDSEAVLDYAIITSLCKRAIFVVAPVSFDAGSDGKAHIRYASCLENIK